MKSVQHLASTFWKMVKRWFDNDQNVVLAPHQDESKIDWARTSPFIILHLSVLAVFLVGWSPIAVTVAILLYAARMFAITGFYHRYFSHRAFRTSRPMQFIFALMGGTAVQRGPLWWASNHRIHHSHSDQPADVHSPVQHGLWWSHMGWVLAYKQQRPDLKRIQDFAKYPELRFLDRFDSLVPCIFAIGVFSFGEWVGHMYPSLATNGWQMLVWGFVISTVALYHGTFTINSLSHRFGRRRYETSDDSRNNFFLALITFGEGWHNNHHFYPTSARQGFRWWEIDMTYYGIRLLEFFRIIWDVRKVPNWVMEQPNSNSINRVSESEKIAI